MVSPMSAQAPRGSPLSVWPSSLRAASPPATAVLDNGLRILCVENPATHTAALSAFAKNDRPGQAPPLAGVRHLVAQILVDCGAYGDPAIADALQDVGAEIHVASAIDFTEISRSRQPRTSRRRPGSSGR